MEIKPEKLYRLKEVAEKGWLGVTYITLYRMARAGRIKTINVSSGHERQRLLIRGEEIIKYLGNN